MSDNDDLAGLVDDLKKYLDRRSRQRVDDPEIVHAFDGNGPDATILKVSHLKRAVDAIEALPLVKADEYARAFSDAMREVAKLVDEEAARLRRLALTQHSRGIPYYEHNEWAARKVEEVAKDIIAAIQVTK